MVKKYALKDLLAYLLRENSEVLSRQKKQQDVLKKNMYVLEAIYKKHCEDDEEIELNTE